MAIGKDVRIHDEAVPNNTLGCKRPAVNFGANFCYDNANPAFGREHLFLCSTWATKPTQWVLNSIRQPFAKEARLASESFVSIFLQLPKVLDSPRIAKPLNIRFARPVSERRIASRSHDGKRIFDRRILTGFGTLHSPELQRRFAPAAYAEHQCAAVAT
jgi:hypothetical protein